MWPTFCDPLDCRMPNFPVHHQLPELIQTHVHRVHPAIQTYHPLLSPSPPAFNLSQHQGLFNESVLPIRWPKHWSFSFSINVSNEYSGRISFMTDWLELPVVQGTFKSLLQHHSWKAAIPRLSAFFLFFSPYARILFLFIYLFFTFIFISWRLITLQYCSGFL